MISFTIAGTDRDSDLELDTLEIARALTYEIDTCSFSLKGEKPTEGEEVIIQLSGVRYFAGIIVKVELSKTFPDKTIKVWKVSCDDYTALLDKRLVIESYENMTADAIFLDIAGKYCADFTTVGVRADAPTIEYIAFDYERPSECFKKLCDYIGWHWQPSYYKDLEFFSAEELASPAPMSLETGGRFVFGKHTVDTSNLRNRIYVRGGTYLSDFVTYEYKADGSQRAWVLPYPPSNVTISINGGAAITPGIENTDDESLFTWMVNTDEKVVRQTSSSSTISAGTTVAFTFKYEIDVITEVEDTSSQLAIAAVQGSDGVYEYVINDDSLTTIEAAEAAGNADLREYANPQVKGDFSTEVNGWVPGQLVDINLTDRGIQGTYLVQKVTLKRVLSNPDIWTYKIEYGGRLKGITDTLKALVSAQQNKKVGSTNILHKYNYMTDTAAVSDEVISTLRTPPFVCGDADAICGLVVC